VKRANLHVCLFNDATAGLPTHAGGAWLKEVLTKALDVTVGDYAGGEAEEGFVDVVASLPWDAQAAEPVQPGAGALNYPAEYA
jgi:hypothetical protein